MVGYLMRLIRRIFGHRNRDFFNSEGNPYLSWVCTRCGQTEEMIFTIFSCRIVEE